MCLLLYVLVHGIVQARCTFVFLKVIFFFPHDEERALEKLHAIVTAAASSVCTVVAIVEVDVGGVAREVVFL